MGEEKKKKKKINSLVRGKYSLWAGCYFVDCKGRVMTIYSNGWKTKKQKQKSARQSEEHTPCGWIVIPLIDVLPVVSC